MQDGKKDRDRQVFIYIEGMLDVPIKQSGACHDNVSAVHIDSPSIQAALQVCGSLAIKHMTDRIILLQHGFQFQGMHELYFVLICHFWLKMTGPLKISSMLLNVSLCFLKMIELRSCSKTEEHELKSMKRTINQKSSRSQNDWNTWKLVSGMQKIKK